MKSMKLKNAARAGSGGGQRRMKRGYFHSHCIFFAIHDEMTQMQAAALPRRQTSGSSESGVRALSAESLNRLSGRPFFLNFQSARAMPAA
ncbi:hypothetical protein [Ottowia cancrivicina]|uniref:Uncharacterized protein n=1 Tax=Ottowia cancrivicina TaxID=3040346 RepID=A0AAW6RN31_9BURK|nr:hypothetical protein [Ottowia sp. 10c7w1]MDG9699756.1 hypothetical protein [Ottowia sp. 10c7w1]